MSSTQLAATSEGGQRRDAGLRLDGARLRRQLRLRGVTAGEVARLSGVSANTLTRCLAGAPISERTLRLVAGVLMDLPMLPGALVADEPAPESEILVSA